MPDMGEQKQIGSASEAVPEPKAGAFLEFDLLARIERLRRERLSRADIASKTLVKYPDLRIALTVMRAGARIEEHKAVGRISVQTVTGHIRMQVPGKLVDLPAGRILALDRAVPHDVEAVEESAYLLTMAVPEAAEGAKHS